jgi:hypothetical protein
VVVVVVVVVVGWDVVVEEIREVVVVVTNRMLHHHKEERIFNRKQVQEHKEYNREIAATMVVVVCERCINSFVLYISLRC